jgi:hypothetical protein
VLAAEDDRRREQMRSQGALHRPLRRGALTWSQEGFGSSQAAEWAVPFDQGGAVTLKEKGEDATSKPDPTGRRFFVKHSAGR